MHYNFGIDCRRDFDGRTDRARREEASREENPHRTQVKGEFIMTKGTLTTTKPSTSRVALIEGDEGFETAAIFASTNPLGITAMGAFPLSLIALGQIRRRNFDDTLTLRPKGTMNTTEELESPQEIEIAALGEQIGTTESGARLCPPSIMKHGLRTSHSPPLTLHHAKVARATN